MHALEIKNVTKQYDGFCLDSVNLCLPRGCIMGLIGENGAGKTTLLHTILQMRKKDSGTVTVFGQDTDTDLCAVKENIGAVLDEVGFPDCLTALQVGRVLKTVYRNWDDGLFQSLLQRLAVPQNKMFKAFSRGMKMKLGIAAALSHHPKLLVLDEATNGLDPVAREEILEILREFTLSGENAVLISSHIVSDLEKICDYIAFLHTGKLLLCAEKDRLQEEYGMLQCSAEQFRSIDRSAVLGKRTSPYGVQAVVHKKVLSDNMHVGAVNLEELFLFMIRGENE